MSASLSDQEVFTMNKPVNIFQRVKKVVQKILHVHAAFYASAAVMGLLLLFQAMPVKGQTIPIREEPFLPLYCYPPPPDLMAWWPFDGNGDELIHGNNALAVNNPLYQSGYVGQSAIVNYTQYFEAAHSPVLNMGMGDFTFEAWLKVANGYSSTIEVLQKRKTGAVSVGYLVFIYGGKIGLQMGDVFNSHYNYVDTRLINDGKWRHIAITIERDNPSGLIFYVDGIASAPYNPMNRQGSLDNEMVFRVGKQGYVSVDEISLYDRTLTALEIAGIYQAGSLGKCK